MPKPELYIASHDLDQTWHALPKCDCKAPLKVAETLYGNGEQLVLIPFCMDCATHGVWELLKHEDKG